MLQTSTMTSTFSVHCPHLCLLFTFIPPAFHTSSSAQSSHTAHHVIFPQAVPPLSVRQHALLLTFIISQTAASPLPHSPHPSGFLLSRRNIFLPRCHPQFGFHTFPLLISSVILTITICCCLATSWPIRLYAHTPSQLSGCQSAPSKPTNFTGSFISVTSFSCLFESLQVLQTLHWEFKIITAIDW